MLAVPGVPASRRRGEYDVQHYIVECRVRTVAVSLPILCAWINLNITPQALTIQFYLYMGEIRPGQAVPSSSFQNADMAVALRFTIIRQQAGCPPALDLHFRQYLRGCGIGATLVNFRQQLPVLCCKLSAVRIHCG